MGFHGKHNNAVGKDPDFGTIFMSNSATKRECFKKGLFGLPLSEIEFVEKIKAGMILFLFEYEKRQLHGVFKAISDGAMNIVPNAFSSLRKQFPAQVKFIPIWHCKPLSESVFRDAIRENYFSATKFNFGLSEKQVRRLLHLFSMRKLETEVPRRSSTRMKDLKSELHPVGKVGRYVDQGRHAESVKDEQGVGANVSPIRRHKFQGDSLQYYGEGENIGFNASGVNKHGRVSELAMDPRSGYVGDYLALQDEFGYATHEKEHYMDIHLTPGISGRFPRSLSSKFGVHGDGELSMSHRFSEDLRKTGQRMVFSDDNLGLHDSDVNQSVFFGKPISEHNSLVQNQLRPTSAMVQPIDAQIARDSCTSPGDMGSKRTLLYGPDYALRSPPILGHNSLAQNNLQPTSAMIDPINSCVTRGGSGSKSTLLYDPDYPGLNFSYSSPVRINNGSMSIRDSAYLSNNCRRNSLSNQTCLMPNELNDMNRCHRDVCYDFLNHGHGHGLYHSDEDKPFNVAHNADQLAAESVVYEAHGGVPSLNSSSALVPPSEIGNSDRVHEPFSSLFHNCKSYVGNDIHLMVLGENLHHEMALEKNNKSLTPDVPWENEGYSQVQYGDPLVHGYESECHGNPQNVIPGYPKKKSSVFSRLTFMQDVKKKQENGNKAWREGYDVNASVDEVMEMVRQSHSQGMPKRKPKPLVKHNKTESLRDKTQIISSKIKSDCSQNIVNDIRMDLAAASVSNTSEPPKEACFVDFKRRSKVRKLEDESKIRSSNESLKSKNVVLVQQKRRKLIRPSFSKNATSDDRGIDLGMPQNLQVPLSQDGSSLNNASENGCALVQNDDSLKTDAEGRNFIGQTHSEDNSGHARGFVCKEGVQASDATLALAAGNDESKFLESINNQNASSSASCKDKNGHIQKGLRVIDSVKSVSIDMESLHSTCQEHHHVDMVICADREVNNKEGMSKDSSFSRAIEFEDGSDSFQKNGNENAPNETSCDINEGLRVMDMIKSVSQDKELLHSSCREHNVDKIACAGKGIVTEEEMLKDGGSSFTVEGKKRSECIQNSGHEKAPSETSKHVNEAARVIHSIKSVSPESEALPSKCQEHHNKITCAGRVIDTEKEVSRDGGSSFSVDVKDGSDCLQNSANENGPVATSSHSNEAMCMAESVNSVSPKKESLHLTCQERHVDMIISAGGRGSVATEEEMSKDGSSSFTAEVADGLHCLRNSEDGNVPIASSEGKTI